MNNLKSEFEELERQGLWGQIFNKIRVESSRHKYTYSESRREENKYLNRYYDVIPYDHSRICLKRIDNDYINANLVRVESAHRSYILTQGPLPNTIEHFWLMIWEQNTTTILMLNRLIERGVIKCFKYWPDEEDEDLQCDKVMLKVHYISKEITPSYIVRYFDLIDLESKKSRQIAQYHYISWPDFGIPESPASFLEFLFTVRDSGALSQSAVYTPVVHCSAGIGRSGTLCLVDACLVLFEKSQFENKVDIKKVLMELRKYRFGLIQTAEQLRFSYLAIIEGLNQLQKLNKVPLNIGDISSQEINDSKDKASSSFNSDETNSLLPSSPKQKRLSPSSASQSESEAKSSDEERLLKSEEEITCNNNLSLEKLRRKAREERNVKMEEKIQRIKKKQKESEERSSFASKRKKKTV